MPQDVQDTFEYALHLAQIGQKYQDTKPLKGFGGAGVLEVVEDFQGNAYRAVYTVSYAAAVEQWGSDSHGTRISPRLMRMAWRAA